MNLYSSCAFGWNRNCSLRLTFKPEIMAQHKHQDNRNKEGTEKKNREKEQKFPSEQFNEDGTARLPAEPERGYNKEIQDPDNQPGRGDQSDLAKSELDIGGEFSSEENDAVLEERKTSDQNRQGGGVSIKSTNEPVGRPQKDGEETENL